MANDQLYQGPIVVRKSPIHGYGVFATQDLAKGTLIEECHFIETITSYRGLQSYVFTHSSLNDKDLFLLGYGSIYNHSSTPNVACEYDTPKKVIRFETLGRIRQGEELLISYGRDWFASRQLTARSLPWWQKLYRRLKLPLRFAMLYSIYWGYLQGLKLLGH